MADLSLAYGVIDLIFALLLVVISIVYFTTLDQPTTAYINFVRAVSGALIGLFLSYYAVKGM